MVVSLVVSGGDSSEMLEFAEEAFDEVAIARGLPIPRMKVVAVPAAWPILQRGIDAIKLLDGGDGNGGELIT